MSELEDALRSELHGRLDVAELDARLVAGVPCRVARLRRRRTALVSGAAVATVALVTGAVVAVPRLVDRNTLRTPVTSTGGDHGTSAAPGLRAAAYARQFAEGDFESIRDDMTPSARKGLTVARLRGVWRSLFDADADVEVGEPSESLTQDRTVGSAVARSATTRAVLRIVLDEDGAIRSVLVTADGDADFEADPGVRRTREVVAQLDAGDYEGIRRDFDPTMAAGLPARRLQQGWKQMEAQYGAFQRVDGVISRLEGKFQVVDAVCEFADGTMKVRVAYDGEQRIAGYFILVLDA